CPVPLQPSSGGPVLLVSIPTIPSSRSPSALHPLFATKERDGLLLYNGRFNEKHDFVALEIVGEQVQLTFSAVADMAGELQGLRLRTLSIGGLAGDGGTVEQGFRGCLQGIATPIIVPKALPPCLGTATIVTVTCVLPTVSLSPGCDVTKGFDPDCNKTTGECRCKVRPRPQRPVPGVAPGDRDIPQIVSPQENHYRPAGSDSCLLFDCYPTRHEGAQRGFRLAATQDVHFTEVGPDVGVMGALMGGWGQEA
ncbi:PREDICTED: cadherin EGF LAG seven-pass G-type receptor 3-like, partial [Nipponia nippon]|uniref:cadherin EGF LAG seven-pass G-type receptor 3-like n=1 Tax=Nipponia nippon TaxID=128390 RepID=UPI0005110D84